MSANAQCLLQDIGCNTIPDVLSHVVHAAAGSTLFRPGDKCRHGLIVLAGRVRVARTSDGGHEVVLYRVAAGEACAITTACMLGNEAYPAYGQVERDVSALALPAEIFLRHLTIDERFRTLVFRQHARSLADLIGRIESITSERIDVRLARCLLAHDNPQLIVATHGEIAGDIGSTREVVSRSLKVFERQGWVRLHRKRIEILAPGILQDLLHGRA